MREPGRQLRQPPDARATYPNAFFGTPGITCVLAVPKNETWVKPGPARSPAQSATQPNLIHYPPMCGCSLPAGHRVRGLCYHGDGPLVPP